MQWILKSPQIHSAFASLGYTRGDLYHVNENCNGTLEEILKNISCEDKSLRSYRRTVSFGQNVQKDIMPLLVHTKDEEMIGFLIKILMNLTIPVECLLSLEVTTRTDFGRHTIFELRNLLTACKNAFVDPRATKTVIDYLKKNADRKQQSKLNMKQCEHIHDCLTLLRNVLHIPDEAQHRHHAAHREHTTSVQNQIFWNLFSQGIDKLIIKLMTMPEASNWSATMVQLVALLYKDQHVGKLQKLLNVWLESSLSESSEDNESNTSPQNRGSTSGSPMLTTDQTTSDSSDNCLKTNGENGESNGDEKEIDEKPTGAMTENDNNVAWNDDIINSKDANDFKEDKDKSIFKTLKSYDIAFVNTKHDNDNKKPEIISNKRSIDELDEGIVDQASTSQSCSPPPTKICKVQGKTSENSDCGYATLIENKKESISTSSNDEDRAASKPVHVKPQNPKQKANTKTRINNNIQEDKRRKKMVKRGKSNILNVRGLQYHQPTDDDIALVLKEFTVDFMLKGYSSLVRTLHNQILNYKEVEIDRCHFFWLVTYFLKFATQMELDLEHVESVLSFDVVSFLTAEGVNLCEQFELAVKYKKSDLKIWRRKLHLVVTAIREFVQAVDTFKRIWFPAHGSHDPLHDLQTKMWETEELRSLMILLIRSYNPDYHDKQYLQDLVVTNHLLLLFLDNVVKMPGYTGKFTMIDHIRQFATPHVMRQYGVLLEDYQTNGEFVNDCVFTIMHHVGGEVESLQSLYQANVIHAFNSIKQSDYEICDHWTDLVEYVMNSFKRHRASKQLALSGEPVKLAPAPPYHSDSSVCENEPAVTCNRWTDDELSALAWNYMQSKHTTDVVGNVVKLYKEEGIRKTRSSVISELCRQNIIDEGQRAGFVQSERSRSAEESTEDDIRTLCEELTQRGHGPALDWVQSVLLEVCYVKTSVAKAAAEYEAERHETPSADYLCKKFMHVMSPVAYHNVLLNKNIPLVPWNCNQAAICKDLKFMQLLSKLNFTMPLESGKLFFRIPHTWTPDVLYEMALKISNIDTNKLKFSINDISRESVAGLADSRPTPAAQELPRKLPVVLPIPEHCYRIQRFKQIGAMVQYTPTPDPTVDVDNKPTAPPKTAEKVDWMALIKKAQDIKVPISPSGRGTQERILLNEKEVSTPSVSNEVKEEVLNDKKKRSDALGPSPGRRSGERSIIHEIPSISEEDSLADTQSVASDFSRMYVSDEDERVELPDDHRRFRFDDLLPEEERLPHVYVHVHHHSSHVHCSGGAEANLSTTLAHHLLADTRACAWLTAEDALDGDCGGAATQTSELHRDRDEDFAYGCDDFLRREDSPRAPERTGHAQVAQQPDDARENVEPPPHGEA